MMFSDVFENIGIERNDYLIRLNNRNLLDALLEQLGLNSINDSDQYLTVMRSIDKLDRLGFSGVTELLGKGRKDKSGDFTKGAELKTEQIDKIINFLKQGDKSQKTDRKSALEKLEKDFCDSDKFSEAVIELLAISDILDGAGYNEDRVAIDPSVVRGLGYYTGPVYEADLIFPKNNDLQNFGSVGGGGRYDSLVERLKGVKVPATGISIGVSRLMTALKLLDQKVNNKSDIDVVVLLMIKDDQVYYFNLASKLRDEGLLADLYVGDGSMKAQLKYADKRNAKIALIIGDDEIENNTVTIKDLNKGAELSKDISKNEEWRLSKDTQVNVPQNEMIKMIKSILSKSS